MRLGEVSREDQSLTGVKAVRRIVFRNLQIGGERPQSTIGLDVKYSKEKWGCAGKEQDGVEARESVNGK